MPRLTRSSSQSVDPEKENAMVSDADDCDAHLKAGALPPNDPSCAIKVLIADSNLPTPCTLYRLPHPRFRQEVLFAIGPKICAEVVSVSDGNRSWFYGDTVVQDGSITMFSPFHPIFVILPFLYKMKDRFAELHAILDDEKYSSLPVLEQNDQLSRTLDKVADVKDVCGSKVCRFNEEKTMEFIKSKHEKIKAHIRQEADLHKAILENEPVLDRYCFGILSDFLSPEIQTLTKDYLQISEEQVLDTINADMDPFRERKRDREGEALDASIEPSKKKIRESASAKILQKASKGTKKLTSFFSKPSAS